MMTNRRYRHLGLSKAARVTGGGRRRRNGGRARHLDRTRLVG
jgi:hypothetical protein